MATETFNIVFKAVGAQVIQRNLNDIGRGGQRATRQLGLMQAGVRGLQRQLVGLRGALGLVTLGLGVRELIHAANTYQTLENRIRIVSASSRDAARTFQTLFRVADQARAPIQGVAITYERVARAGNRLGKSQSELIAITRGVAQAVSLSGATAEGARGALIQFGQALDADFKAVGQEMQSLREQTPRVYAAIVDGLIKAGEIVSRADFREKLRKGMIDSGMVIKALQSQLPQLAKEFSAMDLTIGQSFQKLENAWIKFIGDTGKATGIARLFANAIAGIADSFDKVVAASLGFLSFMGVLKAARVIRANLATSAADIVGEPTGPMRAAYGGSGGNRGVGAARLNITPMVAKQTRTNVLLGTIISILRRLPNLRRTPGARAAAGGIGGAGFATGGYGFAAGGAGFAAGGVRSFVMPPLLGNGQRRIRGTVDMGMAQSTGRARRRGRLDGPGLGQARLPPQDIDMGTAQRMDRRGIVPSSGASDFNRRASGSTAGFASSAARSFFSRAGVAGIAAASAALASATGVLRGFMNLLRKLPALGRLAFVGLGGWVTVAAAAIGYGVTKLLEWGSAVETIDGIDYSGFDKIGLIFDEIGRRIDNVTGSVGRFIDSMTHPTMSRWFDAVVETGSSVIDDLTPDFLKGVSILPKASVDERQGIFTGSDDRKSLVSSEVFDAEHKRRLEKDKVQTDAEEKMAMIRKALAEESAKEAKAKAAADVIKSKVKSAKDSIAEQAFSNKLLAERIQLEGQLGALSGMEVDRMNATIAGKEAAAKVTRDLKEHTGGLAEEARKAAEAEYLLNASLEEQRALATGLDAANKENAELKIVQQGLLNGLSEIEIAQQTALLQLKQQLDPLRAKENEADRIKLENKLKENQALREEAELMRRSKDITARLAGSGALGAGSFDVSKKGLMDQFKQDKKDVESDPSKSADEIQRDLQGLQVELTTNLDDAYKSSLMSANTWSSGVIAGLMEVRDSSNNFAEDFKAVTVDAFRSAEDALVEFVETGKLDFKGFIDEIQSQLLRLSIRHGIINPLSEWLFGVTSGGASAPQQQQGGGNLLGGLFGKLLGGGGSSPSGSIMNNLLGGIGKMFGFGEGGGGGNSILGSITSGISSLFGDGASGDIASQVDSFSALSNPIGQAAGGDSMFGGIFDSFTSPMSMVKNGLSYVTDGFGGLTSSITEGLGSIGNLFSGASSAASAAGSGFGAFSGLSSLGGAGAGASFGVSSAATNALGAGAASGGFQGFSGLSGLGSGIGTGAAPTGFLAGAGGALLGAALPLAIPLLGSMWGDAKRAAKNAKFAPVIQTALDGVITEVEKVWKSGDVFKGNSYSFTNPLDGRNYLSNVLQTSADMIGKRSILPDVIDPASGLRGELSAGGFESDIDKGRRLSFQDGSQDDGTQETGRIRILRDIEGFQVRTENLSQNNPWIPKIKEFQRKDLGLWQRNAYNWEKWGDFATGGSFRVGGMGGTDSQLVQFKASPNEMVTVRRPDQSVDGGGGMTVVNNFTIHAPNGTIPQETQMQIARRTGQAARSAIGRS